jgi:DNA (cytosine-5)-methyltransferase 1
MRFGSVCSGIEAASVAWEPLGWKAAWFSEIEKFPCEVLQHHYPDTPNLGDMTTLPDRILSGEIEAPEIFCGGTPCQAFSVAGLRKSLDDARGNLSLTFCEIADAIDESRLVRGLPACIVFWENVPGVLSTSDNAFGCFLAQLCGGNEPLVAPDAWPNAGIVSGPRRTAAWRILDAQHFGVAQRRRRVFVVASARADFDPAAVLFEFDGVRRDSAPSREARQSVAPTIAGCSNGGGSNGPGRDVDSCESLQIVQPYQVANCLTQRMHKGINSTVDEGQTPIIDIRGQPQAVAFDWKMGEKARSIAINKEQAPTLGAQADRYAVAMMPCIGLDQELNARKELAGTLQRKGDGGFEGSVMNPSMQVRRLTPVECERLQGFPDNYTNIKDKCPDGPRYKALGNSWAVPVVRWIGKRIQEHINAP